MDDALNKTPDELKTPEERQIRRDAEERNKLNEILEAKEEELRAYQEEADWQCKFKPPMVDVTGDAQANTTLLAFLQLMEVLPPLATIRT